MSPGEMFWKRRKKQGHIRTYTMLLSNDKIGVCSGPLVAWDGLHLWMQEGRSWKVKGQMPLWSFGLMLLFSSPSSQRTQDLPSTPLQDSLIFTSWAKAVGWLGNLRNLFLNNLLRSVTISHLDPETLLSLILFLNEGSCNTVNGVAKSWTRLSDFTFESIIY